MNMYKEKVRILQNSLDMLTDIEKVLFVIVSFEGRYLNFLDNGSEQFEPLPHHAKKFTIDGAKEKIKSLNMGFTYIPVSYEQALKNSLERAKLELYYNS